MSSVLLAAAPQNLPGGLTGALVLLALGMIVVFSVLGGLTLVIWLIGKLFRERPPEPATEGARPAEAATAPDAAATPAATEPPAVGTTPTPAETAAVAAAVALESSGRTVPVGGPFTSDELAAVTTAVALESSGRTVPVGGPFTSDELAAVTTAVALAAGAPASTEAAAIAAAIRYHEAGFAGGTTMVQLAQDAPQPGAGAWGEAAFAGRGSAGLPALRRG